MVQSKTLTNTYSSEEISFNLIVKRILLEHLLLKCCVVPMYLNSPSTIIAKRVKMVLHSAISCNDSKTDLPDL